MFFFFFFFNILHTWCSYIYFEGDIAGGKTDCDIYYIISFFFYI